MNKQPVRGVDASSISEDAIADYLQQNPDFFERHSTLLAKLKVPHARGAATVSLVERQVAVLREKNDKLESRLRELIEVARDNDALTGKIHRLACRLLRARTPATLIDALEASLREDFGASEWIMVLWPEAQSEYAQIASRHLRLIDAKAPELKMFETLFESGRPRCGQIRDSQRDYLFGVGTVEIGSAALVPLGSPIVGLLAIGSPDTERFHPTMSTDFLARIGQLVSEAIAGV
jgi:uncharacterized protein YigA (DUF484 family)